MSRPDPSMSRSRPSPDIPPWVARGRGVASAQGSRGNAFRAMDPRQRVRRMMRAILTVFLVTFFLGALLSLMALWVFYRAVSYVPEFYAERSRWEEAELGKAYEVFIQRTNSLHAELRRKPEVEGILPEEEVNGWLAIQGPRLWGGDPALSVRRPRLQFSEKAILVGAEVQTRWFRGVAWAVLEPAVRGPDVIAIRFKEVRLGRIPIPTDRLPQLVVSGFLSEVAGHRATGFWETSEGRPVLVLQLDIAGDPRTPERIQIEDVRVGEKAMAVRLRLVRGR